MKPRTFMQKPVNQLSLVPPGTVHVEPDCIASETPIEMAKDFHKAFPIPSSCADDSITAQEGSHPTRKIKSLTMLAGCRDAKRMSHLCPSPPQPGMQSKSGLILEDHCLLRTQILKFFLTRGQTASPLPFSPGDRRSPPFLNDIPVDASSSEPVELSISGHIDASSVPPCRWS